MIKKKWRIKQIRQTKKNRIMQRKKKTREMLKYGRNEGKSKQIKNKRNH